MRKLQFSAMLRLADGCRCAQPAYAQSGSGRQDCGQYICVFNEELGLARQCRRRQAQVAARPLGGAVDARLQLAPSRLRASTCPDAVAATARGFEPATSLIASRTRSSRWSRRARTAAMRGASPPGSGTPAAQETPWGIARVNGGAAGTFATAWVIDTGIDFDHPDLNVDKARSRPSSRVPTTPTTRTVTAPTSPGRSPRRTTASA